jgi:hypothetical protein
VTKVARPASELCKAVLGRFDDQVVSALEWCLTRSPEEAVANMRRVAEERKLASYDTQYLVWCADAIARSTTIIGTLAQFREAKEVLSVQEEVPVRQ